MAWKQSRPDSLNVYIVLGRSSRRGDSGGILVEEDAYPSVWRICVSSPTPPMALALARLSLGALEEDMQDACEVC